MTPLLAALSVTAVPTLVALAVGALALWGVSLARKDASIADPFWAPAFLLIAVVSLLAHGPEGLGSTDPLSRAHIVLACVAMWAVRLGRHLLRRNLGHGEDPRYAAMRAGHGARFWWVSLFTVFLLQAGLAWGVSLPVQAAIAAPAPLGPLDAIAAAMFLFGFGCEAMADVQLVRFRADPASRGKVLDTGLWRYSRHPNYFGNAVMWWGLGLFGVAVGAWPALVGPLVMTVLLLKVSGVALLERDIGQRRPDYARYIRRTSAFVPWFPKADA